ncbi:MAG: ribokinase [Eubacteriales bacterium]|nr:ribokinase [Eubacteriales bacterium]
MKKVLNFGSMNIDYVYRIPHILTPGETLGAKEMQVFCGGKGLNQSVAMARAGVQVYHAGSVGEEGDDLLAFLENEGVDIRYCRKMEGKSGHTIIQVDDHGQNCILVFGGANKRQDHNHIRRVFDAFRPGDFVVLQNEINDPAFLLSEAAERGLKIVLNPSPINDELPKLDLSSVDYFVINEVEGLALTGSEEANTILQVMRERYPNATVVLTLGERGAYASVPGETQLYYQKAFEVEVIDTTAAGDTFLGYFVSGVLEGLPIQSCLRQSALAAAVTVTRSGAAPSIPRKEEVAG